MNGLDIIRALQPGEVVQIPHIDNIICDLLYAEFTQRRIDGTLRFVYISSTGVLTVTDERKQDGVTEESDEV
tara:strand:- start:289 stop:504 length:216 start_codon:yes stop_codon:yes gene_type:complete